MKPTISEKLKKSIDLKPQNSLLHKCVEEREQKGAARSWNECRTIIYCGMGFWMMCPAGRLARRARTPALPRKRENLRLAAGIVRRYRAGRSGYVAAYGAWRVSGSWVATKIARLRRFPERGPASSHIFDLFPQREGGRRGNRRRSGLIGWPRISKPDRSSRNGKRPRWSVFVIMPLGPTRSYRARIRFWEWSFRRGDLGRLGEPSLPPMEIDFSKPDLRPVLSPLRRISCGKVGF
jgi:hypothetical protein